MSSCKGKTLAKPAGNSCDRRPPQSKENTLADWVEEYLKDYGNCYQKEAKWWGDKTLDWDRALERAWLSQCPNGKMHPHQCNVGYAKLAEGLKVAQSDNIQADYFQTFEQLFNWVKSVTGPICRLGKMTTYDVSLRLGMWLDLYPTVVYLHRGTAEGAKKFNVKGETAPLSAFPPEIQKLEPIHAENFLCIYKDCL